MTFFRSKISDRLTPEEINLALSDYYDTALPNFETQKVWTIVTFTFIGCVVLFLILFILDQIVAKYRNSRKEPNENENINKTMKVQKKKEKQSPFVGPTSTVPQPTFYKLDKAEKGQNISLNYRIPYRRTMETEKSNHETKITILVQENKQESLDNK